jgi:2-polyprenyl-3-methyl-5-hydroxy-6-metoxy-1,4-benzoquinol methylase
MIAFILKQYLWLHEILHKRIVSRLGCVVYGIHPKEHFGRRYEFFSMYVSKGDVVIDIACGSGTILHKIRNKIKNGYGVDYSEKQIELCNKLHGGDNLSYHKVDVLDMDYKHAKGEVKYNVALFSHILEHVENVPEFLNKVDADKILICVPSEDHWYRLLMKGLGLDIRTDRGHFREYNIEMLLEELDKAKYHANCAGYNSDGDIVCYAVKIR